MQNEDNPDRQHFTIDTDYPVVILTFWATDLSLVRDMPPHQGEQVISISIRQRSYVCWIGRLEKANSNDWPKSAWKTA